jgi:hypothetical protein
MSWVINQSFCPFIDLPYLSVYCILSICLALFILVYLSVRPSVFLSIRLPILTHSESGIVEVTAEGKALLLLKLQNVCKGKSDLNLKCMLWVRRGHSIHGLTFLVWTDKHKWSKSMSSSSWVQFMELWEHFVYTKWVLTWEIMHSLFSALSHDVSSAVESELVTPEDIGTHQTSILPQFRGSEISHAIDCFKLQSTHLILGFGRVNLDNKFGNISDFFLQCSQNRKKNSVTISYLLTTC